MKIYSLILIYGALLTTIWFGGCAIAQNNYEKGYNKHLEATNKERMSIYTNGIKKGLQIALKTKSDTLTIKLKDLDLMLNAVDEFKEGKKETIYIVTED